MELPKSVLTKRQRKFFNAKFKEKGQTFGLVATVRHDDDCGNGHNTFSITADLWELKNGMKKGNEPVACGCLHDEIEKYFPTRLAQFLKWHLASTDSPMHYVANTLYHASDRDCWGKRKDEPYHFENVVVFGENPVHHLEGRPKFTAWLKERGQRGYVDLRVVAIEHKKEPGGYNFTPKYTVQNDGEQFGKQWHECPFDSRDEAIRFVEALRDCEPRFLSRPTQWGEGKEPDLDAARRTAIWPDATLNQLQDKDALTARLPALMAEFKAAVESLGLVY